MLVLKEILAASIKHKHTLNLVMILLVLLLTMDGFEMLASIALKVPKECFKKAQQQKKLLKSQTRASNGCASKSQPTS